VGTGETRILVMTGKGHQRIKTATVPCKKMVVQVGMPLFHILYKVIMPGKEFINFFEFLFNKPQLKVIPDLGFEHFKGTYF